MLLCKLSDPTKSRKSGKTIVESVHEMCQEVFLAKHRWDKSGQDLKNRDKVLEGLQRYLAQTIAQTHQLPGMFVRKFKNEWLFWW